MDSQELFENIFNRIPKIHADIYLGILRNTINEPIILEQKIMKALQEMVKKINLKLYIRTFQKKVESMHLRIKIVC